MYVCDTKTYSICHFGVRSILSRVGNLVSFNHLSIVIKTFYSKPVNAIIDLLRKATMTVSSTGKSSGL